MQFMQIQTLKELEMQFLTFKIEDCVACQYRLINQMKNHVRSKHDKSNVCL